MRLYLIVAFLKQSALFKNAILPNGRILKTFFTLTLKCATYAFLLPFFSSASFSHMFMLSSFLSSSSSLHCLLRAIGKFVLSSLLLLHHWFMYFFRFSYLFVFFHCSKVTTISLPHCCLAFCCAVFFPLLMSSSLLSRRSSPP